MIREMKDSDIDWIGDVPKNWNILPNKYLMKKLKTVPPKYSNEPILSLTMDGVIVRDLEAGGKMPTTFDGYQKISKGNLLMCLFDIDVTPRCIGLIKQDGVTSPAYTQFVLINENYAPYYYYLYLYLDNDKLLLPLAKNLRHSLTEDVLGEIPMIQPPLSEQQSIANYLDYKTSQIDALVTNIEAQIVKLDEYKKALITQTVTKGLDPNVELKDSGVEWIGEIPKRWEIYNPKYLFKQQVARAKLGQKQLTASQKYGVISQKEFMNRENQSIVPVEKDFSILKQVVPGDFVISMRSFQGGLEYSDMEGSISSAYVMVHKTNDQVENRYYKWLFKSSCYIDALQPTSNLIRDGQAMRFTNFQLVRIPLPPIDEQKDIAVYLDQKCHQIDSLKDSLIQQKKSLSDYKKTLIFDYVTGKKEVPTSWDKERSDE